MSVLFCFQIAQKPLLSQVTAPPFTITLEEVTYSDWPGIHSFALGEWDGRWLIMTGRTGGLHGFLPPTPFPIIDANKQIHLFDLMALNHSLTINIYIYIFVYYIGKGWEVYRIFTANWYYKNLWTIDFGRYNDHHYPGRL